jgi:hypothetical protein
MTERLLSLFMLSSLFDAIPPLFFQSYPSTVPTFGHRTLYWPSHAQQKGNRDGSVRQNQKALDANPLSAASTKMATTGGVFAQRVVRNLTRLSLPSALAEAPGSRQLLLQLSGPPWAFMAVFKFAEVGILR